ncbi:hypothetical protein GCM10010430_06610 [Kitasatospora cystarginea]|uniref:PhzF family phenazine biosynthesis protein n=1 Tax=Kitasatospora cystarginea TaxID=58350 RepID=A0ABN3DEY0_9ACTN
MTEVHAWWGRVFAQGSPGGNHTVIVLPGVQVVDRAAVAARFAVPDTGFVTGVHGNEITLRTFSPVEELAQCLQTSLAALTALGVPEGERRLVRHERGEQLELYREGAVTWARETAPGSLALEHTDWPNFVMAEPAPGSGPVILRQARSRVHLRCADAKQLDGLDIRAADVLELCARTGTNGLVLSAPADDGLRVRVFTTSLSGREDSATGGAVLGVGRLTALDGVRGDLAVVQGPAREEQQGRLHLRLTGRGEVLLGGTVESLMTGRTAFA